MSVLVYDDVKYFFVVGFFFNYNDKPKLNISVLTFNINMVLNYVPGAGEPTRCSLCRRATR